MEDIQVIIHDHICQKPEVINNGIRNSYLTTVLFKVSRNIKYYYNQCLNKGSHVHMKLLKNFFK